MADVSAPLKFDRNTVIFVFSSLVGPMPETTLWKRVCNTTDEQQFGTFYCLVVEPYSDSSVHQLEPAIQVITTLSFGDFELDPVVIKRGIHDINRPFVFDPQFIFRLSRF